MASHEQDNCARNLEGDRTALIRTLNDQLRCQQKGGQVYLTQGIFAFGNQVPSILAAIGAFNDFDEDNDPHGEHDFGVITFNGQKIFWKIDYYDANMEYGSPDPTDEDVTTRVLTIMRANEY